jgi:hypothetical protein
MTTPWQAIKFASKPGESTTSARFKELTFGVTVLPESLHGSNRTSHKSFSL